MADDILIDPATVRNVAIIAHVDHGKTTLVDALLRQSGLFRDPAQVRERALDEHELERERGITILAKVTTVPFEGLTVNLVDTPGHRDFGGEVERVLTIVDGALLVVDAAEGPMPQTRYVLSKALQAGLRLVVVVNKMDRADARPAAVADAVLELFMDLGADGSQLDYPVVYASGRLGVAALTPILPATGDLHPLVETLRRFVPAPRVNRSGPLQMRVTTLDYDPYLGRLALGRIERGVVRPGQVVAVVGADGAPRLRRLLKVYKRLGLTRQELAAAGAGDIVAVAGLDDVAVGETVADPEAPTPLPPVVVDEPTLTMLIGVNTSPFAGREGRYVTSRHLRERLYREAEHDVGLRVEDTEDPEVFRVSGRGELHLGIIIETLRREGYEMQVAKPEVVTRVGPDGVEEPFEQFVVEVPETEAGAVMEELGRRRAILEGMRPGQGSYVRLSGMMPARGLLGLRMALLTATRGQAALHHVFAGYAPYAGAIPETPRGALVALETGIATAYALDNAQQRGILFIGPGTPVYAGMVVGEHSRPQDLELNVCKKKHVTNVRNSNAEEAIRLAPPRILTLDTALVYLKADELLEVTPTNLRLRKATLDRHQRKRERRSP